MAEKETARRIDYGRAFSVLPNPQYSILRREISAEETLPPFIKEQLAGDFRRWKTGITGKEYPVLPNASYRVIFSAELAIAFLTNKPISSLRGGYELPVAGDVETALRVGGNSRAKHASEGTGGLVLIEIPHANRPPYPPRNDDIEYDVVFKAGLPQLSRACQDHIARRLPLLFLGEQIHPA
ncbi:hypothetical protein M1615_00670 [Patescibacteria group bacterium]|nr:hypothetical protein [Patescibacteria group bacterium]MCL5010204.1 hypothetical protein [Patescibacteria group bacterium]